MIVLGRAAVVRPVLLLLAGYIALWRRVCRASDQHGSGDDQGWNENECATGEYVQRSLLFHGRTRREDNTPATQGDMQIKRLCSSDIWSGKSERGTWQAERKV